ncbi:hypothetical protein Ocin01_00808 [Orchesella cincta]|uniref:Uncharacterized protein n=1 Tax=Orchesella cincta TaxID=48709 RepID=A0A1D2NKW1_ORCCI|nr:hypothetical protein Ocin01_00808 [Orchesella cincta]
MIRFNLVSAFTFTLLGLVAAFPQMRYIRMAVPDVAKDPGDTSKATEVSQQNPSAASSNLDSQQLKQSVMLGGPVKFVPGITRIRTNPESLRSKSSPKKEILIDLYENEPEPPKRKFSSYIDLEWQNGESSQADALSQSSTGNSWQSEGENTGAADESHTSSTWQTGEENAQVNPDASQSSVANVWDDEDTNNPKTDSPQSSSSSNNRMNADPDDTQQDSIKSNDKYNDSKAPQEAETNTATRKYNAPANTPEYPDEFAGSDRRAPVIVPSSEMASFLKALGSSRSRSGNLRRPAAIASANLADQPLDYDVPSTSQFLRRIATQQSQLRDLLIQVLYRQTTLRDDIHRIDMQLTHVQQGLGMHGTSYDMHNRYIPSY